MSKEKDDKKEVGPPLDIQTEMKMLSYTITLKDMEVNDLQLRNKELSQCILNMEKEKKEIKANYVQSLRKEKTVQQMQEALDHAEREIEKLKEERRLKEIEGNEVNMKLTKKFETEIHNLNLLLDTYQKKMENVNNLQIVVERQDGVIKQLEGDKEKLKTEADEKIKNKEIRNQIKFSELKKKMMESIQETQKNVTQLNIEYMDVSTKLTLLQNHQLLIELEYQSQQIEALILKKENLEKKVFELTQDIEVHKEVELALASKNKKYSDMIKNLEKNSDTENNLSNINNDSSNLHKSVYVNSGLKEFTMINSLEKKILKLDAALKKKGEDFLKLKSNFEFIEDKLKSNEKKYAGLFYLFEEGLRKFVEDEDILNNRDIYVNLESIKRCDFSNLNNNEQYSTIVLLMKYLIPLINPNDLKGSEFGMANNFENVNVKYHMSKKFKDVPLLKKVFSTNKNTMMHSIRKGLEKLPLINSAGLSTKSKSNVLLLSSDKIEKHSKFLI